MDRLRQYQDDSCGPGGVRCDCCNSYHGKDRKILNRMAKRKLDREIKKDIEKELTDI